MSHFYEITESGNVIFRDDVTTAAQAKAAEGNVVASVTTKIKVMSNDFFDKWRLKKVFSLAKDHPDKSFDEINEMMWGQREMPSGEIVSSADFGTEVHRQLEIGCNNYAQGEDYDEPEWNKYVRPFISWLSEKNIDVYETEYMIGCTAHNTAGTIDLVAMNQSESKFELFDYKTRECKNNIKTKAYQKDAMQLAVQAVMLKYNYMLPYLPSISTVIIDSDTGDTHVKKWTEKAQEKAYSIFDRCSKLYDAVEGMSNE